MDSYSESHHRILTVNIAKQQEKQFLEVAFRVGENVEEIEVNMTVRAQNDERATIDLGMRGANGIRGWSGGARSTVVLRPETATPGYLPGTIEPGDWAVLLGVYEVPAQGVSVELSIDCVPVKPRWLCGDLHSHTVHSDGAFSIDEAANRAQACGLDFLALTDHNTYSQNLGYPRDLRVLFIPGMELTTYSGHVNLIGVANPVDDFRVASQSDLRGYLQTAATRGALISVNHPFEMSCDSCAWRWEWDSVVDAVEVWNGPWHEANDKALTWWQASLASGRRLTAIGGSDTHNLQDPSVQHGRPTTWVYARQYRRDDILRAIRQRRVFISYAPSGPRLNISCGPYLMGDVVPERGPHLVRVGIERLEANDEILLISDRGIEQRTVAGQEEPAVEMQVTRHGERFYRIEVWRWFQEGANRMMAAMSNPIYFEEG